MTVLGQHLQLGPPSRPSAGPGRPAAEWSAGWRPPPRPGSAGCGRTALTPSAGTPWCHTPAPGRAGRTWEEQKTEVSLKRLRLFSMMWWLSSGVISTCGCWSSGPPLPVWWSAPCTGHREGWGHSGTDVPNCPVTPGRRLKHKKTERYWSDSITFTRLSSYVKQFSIHT